MNLGPDDSTAKLWGLLRCASSALLGAHSSSVMYVQLHWYGMLAHICAAKCGSEKCNLRFCSAVEQDGEITGNFGDPCSSPSLQYL
jgi:hypothetical protein